MFACVSLRIEDRVIKAFSLVSVLTVCFEPVVKTPHGYIYAFMAQWIRRLSTEQEIQGSSPCRGFFFFTGGGGERRLSRQSGVFCITFFKICYIYCAHKIRSPLDIERQFEHNISTKVSTPWSNQVAVIYTCEVYVCTCIVSKIHSCLDASSSALIPLIIHLYVWIYTYTSIIHILYIYY